MLAARCPSGGSRGPRGRSPPDVSGLGLPDGYAPMLHFATKVAARLPSVERAQPGRRDDGSGREQQSCAGIPFSGCRRRFAFTGADVLALDGFPASAEDRTPHQALCSRDVGGRPSEGGGVRRARPSDTPPHPGRRWGAASVRGGPSPPSCRLHAGRSRTRERVRPTSAGARSLRLPLRSRRIPQPRAVRPTAVRESLPGPPRAAARPGMPNGTRRSASLR